MTRENSTARLKFDRSLISRSFFNYRSSFFFLSPSGKRKEIGGRKRSVRSVRERKASKLREWCPVTFFFFFFFFPFWKEEWFRVCVYFGPIVSIPNEEDFFPKLFILYIFQFLQIKLISKEKYT